VSAYLKSDYTNVATITAYQRYGRFTHTCFQWRSQRVEDEATAPQTSIGDFSKYCKYEFFSGEGLNVPKTTISQLNSASREVHKTPDRLQK